MPKDDISQDSVEPSSDNKRGHQASSPPDISWRGWWDITRRVINNVNRHDISLLAAGVALFMMLSIFPALNVGVSLFGLFSSPDIIISQVEPLRQLLPEQAFTIFTDQLTELTSTGEATFNLTLVVSLVLWLWVARKGAMAVIKACNIIYREQEKRPFWNLLLMSLLFTVVGIFSFVVLALLAILVPIILSMIPLGKTLETLLITLRWPILAVIFILILECVYRFAPNRKNAKWRWVSVGAIIATLLWLLASFGFTVYVQNFSNYNETYGAIGSVIILILWFYLSAFVVLLGAEINAEIELQTKVDSTVGEDKPMGQRGAYVADTPVTHSSEVKQR
ncbi:YihY/virulence factor BrkB family protein [Methylophaga sp.]|uniref:YihY/virulence factor BrkB family protein n=1 Tax=Methylophaga sp. TaxID=2024840 RepID=UPI003A8DBFC3